MVGTPHLQPVPSPSSGTCVHAVTRTAVAESASASLDLGQGGLEEVVVASVDQINCSHVLHVTLTIIQLLSQHSPTWLCPQHLIFVEKKCSAWKHA